MDVEHGLVVHDEEGKPRILLSAKGGQPLFLLEGKDGSLLELHLSEGGCTIRVGRREDDASGHATLTLDPQGCSVCCVAPGGAPIIQCRLDPSKRRASFCSFNEHGEITREQVVE